MHTAGAAGEQAAAEGPASSPYRVLYKVGDDLRVDQVVQLHSQQQPSLGLVQAVSCVVRYMELLLSKELVKRLSSNDEQLRHLGCIPQHCTHSAAAARPN